MRGDGRGKGRETSVSPGYIKRSTVKVRCERRQLRGGKRSSLAIHSKTCYLQLTYGIIIQYCIHDRLVYDLKSSKWIF